MFWDGMNQLWREIVFWIGVGAYSMWLSSRVCTILCPLGQVALPWPCLGISEYQEDLPGVGLHFRKVLHYNSKKVALVALYLLVLAWPRLPMVDEFLCKLWGRWNSFLVPKTRTLECSEPQLIHLFGRQLLLGLLDIVLSWPLKWCF